MIDAVLLRPDQLPEAHFEIDDAEMRGLVKDLHKADRGIYWTDLISTCAVGWGCFAGALVIQPLSVGMLLCLAVSVCALYRALCFMHELTHQHNRSLPKFEFGWNCLVGFPLLMPSIVYVGVHQSHHRISSYGTADDPEYMPFAHNPVMTTMFALESFLIPAILLLRFIVLTPIGFVFPRFQRWLIVHATSLTMNLKYKREVTDALTRTVRHDTAIVFALWSGLIGLSLAGIVPVRFFLTWFAVTSLVSFVNTLRTLGAHAYENEGEPLDRTGQLLDSIDTPGAFWTELWAPVGLRYHALHHYFPGIPYHNLPEAYRRVVGHLPVAEGYKRMSSESLPHSIVRLYRKALSR